MATKQQKQQQRQQQQVRKSSLDMGGETPERTNPKPIKPEPTAEFFKGDNAPPIEALEVSPENVPGPEDQTVAVDSNKVDTLPVPKPLVMVADEFQPKSDPRTH